MRALIDADGEAIALKTGFKDGQIERKACFGVRVLSKGTHVFSVGELLLHFIESHTDPLFSSILQDFSIKQGGGGSQYGLV